MAVLTNHEIYTLELYTKPISAKGFLNLIAVDNNNTIYLAQFVAEPTKARALMYALQDHKTGIVRRSEGNSKEPGHKSYNVFAIGKNSYDTFDNKNDDLLTMLMIAKCAKPNAKLRKEWQEEEDARLSNGLPARRAPEELLLAWDGDFRSQIYRVLWDRYNTPMLEEWKDYIVDQCIERSYYEPLTVKAYGLDHPLEAGLLRITEKQLEEIISEGISSYELDFAIMEDGRTDDEAVLQHCSNLDDYLTHFAGELGTRIQENSEVRFDPTKQKHHPILREVNLHANNQGVTGLFPQQADVVMGVANTLSKESYAFIIGEMGTGKTPLGATVPYVTEAVLSKTGTPDPFRALVFVPAIMVKKWMREIQERVPGAKVHEIRNWRDAKALQNLPKKPSQVEYYVMSSDAAKATYPMEPIENWREDKEASVEARKNGDRKHIAMVREEYQYDGETRHRIMSGERGYYCPECGGPLKVRGDKMSTETFFKTRSGADKDRWSYKRKDENMYCNNLVETKYLPKEKIKDPNKAVQKCGFVLWRPALLKPTSLARKVSPAWYINKYLPRGFFKYLIADEVHEYKAGDTDRANAFGQLINHTEKQLLLTGTLLGGLASDIFYLLARLDPKRLKREGIHYDDLSAFIQRYGVFEHSFKRDSGTQSRKKSGQKERAGVSPMAFPRFLMNNCAFLELADLGYALPPYREEPIFVEMDALHMEKYQELETNIGNQMRLNVAQGGMKHVSTYVNRIYQYADMPFNQGPVITYGDDGRDHILAQPYNFDDTFSPSKYHTLLSMLDQQVHDRNRKVMVYCRFTGENAIDTWLYERLKEEGYKVGILRSNGSYDGLKMPKQQDREQWLKDMMAKHDWDVLITNPRLVSVGLDLLMFPTIVYYQMDYSTYNYMQSSRRSWRIKQTEDVEIYTLVYRETIQSDVLEHIAKKIDAALALQGKFSEEGLRAMADSGDGINALAKKLMSEGRLDNVSSIEDRWKRINQTHEMLKEQDYSITGYEEYTEFMMNPLGIEEIRRIQRGVVDTMVQEIAAGKRDGKDLTDYLKKISDMFVEMQNVSDYNRGLSKKHKVSEGQLALF